MKLFKSRTTTFVMYYLVLLLVFVSWQNYDSVPSGALRIAYLLALVVPLYFVNVRAFPAIITLFFTISMFGFTTSYMPARYYTYIAATAIAVLISMRQPHQKVPLSVVLLFLIVTVVNLMYELSWEYVSSAFVLLLMFFLIVDKNYEEQSTLFTYTFIVSSLVLSLYYIIIGPRFLLDYRVSEGLERIGFADINYGGTVVGMGMFAAFVERMKNKHVPLLLRIIIDITIALSTVSLVMNASRGAVLAVSAAVAVLLVFSKIKPGYKFLYIVLLSAFVIFIYSKGYMDLLLYRVENDELGGGSGRADIWQIKLDSFFTEATPYEWIMGMGFTGGRHLGWGSDQRAFHNDFLAFMVNYGLIGLTLFIAFFLKPLRNIEINKSFIYAGMAFLFVACMTLEPFTAGRLPFFVFWFYLLQLSKSNQIAFGKNV